MPRFIALEWDLREARVAVARTRGEGVVVEQAFTVDLGPRDAGQTFADVHVGEKVGADLGARNVGRADTLVAVGRASIELRQLTLPPAPPEELPDLVRFQSLREFTTIGESWPIDFVPLNTSEDESLNVLAVAISPEMVAQIKETCRAADVTPKRLVLRPFAAASLLRRRDGSAARSCRLMVDLLADEADLTVLAGDDVALMRTVRLSSQDPTAQSRALLGEIRRTIASAQNQLRGRRVEKVVLCGDGSDQAALKEALETALALEVELFDPFGQLELEPELQASRPEHAGRFAPLLGMLLDEATGTGHPIDFLHPRQRPAPPNNRRRNVLLGAAAATAGLAAAFAVWMGLQNLDDTITDRQLEKKQLEKNVEAARKSQDHAAALQAFVASDFNWLDELHDLSRDLPPPEEVILTQLNLSTRSPQGGQIVVDGYTRESEQISGLRDQLRNDGRSLVSTGTQVDPRRQDYQWLFKETILLEPGEQAASQPKPPEATPEPQTAAAPATGKESQTR